MRVGFDETTYEDIVGTPEEVARDARWLSGFSTPRSTHSLKRLTATCLPGWHPVTVGGEWRWDDEEIRLDETRTVTWATWKRARNDFNRTWVLPCPKCGGDQRMAARGWEWA